MSNIINKILGRDDEQSHSTHGKTETHTSVSFGAHEKNTHRKNSRGEIIEGRTIEQDGVNIKSTISSDATSTVSLANQQKLNDLVTKLGSTHNQVDEYAKKQTARINNEIQKEIDEVVARTRREQDALLRQANEHTSEIDREYRAQLQKMVEQIDADKARRIGDVEQLLNRQQADILQLARKEIDELNQKAANLKIGAIQQAQMRATNDASEITAQAANLGQASTVHQSTGTTTIKTQVSATATTKDAECCNATTAINKESSSCAETKRIETSRDIRK